MKHTIIFSALSCLLLFSVRSYASHAQGGELSYRCIDSVNQTYEITYNFYRDCSGIAAPSMVLVNYTSASCNVTNALTLVQVGIGIDVTPICPAQLSNSFCAGGTLPGTDVWQYKATVQSLPRCNDWVFSYQECCRNSAITNLLNASVSDLYTEARLNNLDFNCNNSPTFDQLAAPVFCVNQFSEMANTASDVDGDQIVYSVINPLTGGPSPIPFMGFSTSEPFETNGTFTFDSTNGQLSFVSPIQQVSALTMLLEEYRSGVFVGSVMRDVQIIVTNCTNIVPEIIPDSLPTGVLLTGPNNYSACAGNAINFELNSFDPNVADVVTLDVDISQLAGATYTPNGNRGTLEWVAQPGTYQFIVTVTDDACPFFGTRSQVYNIVVEGLSISGDDTVSYCGEPVQLTSNGSSPVWSPSTGLSCSTCPNPLASPAVSTYYFLQSDCGADSVYVQVVNGYDITVSGDTLVCENAIADLEVSVNVPGSYTFSWQPANQILDPTLDQTTAQVSDEQTYSVVVTSSDGCIRQGEIDVVVQGAAPEITATSNKTNMCLGDTAVLDAGYEIEECTDFIVSEVTLLPLQAIGTPIILADDAVSPAVNLGFNFNFFCENYNQMYVGSNGFVSFDAAAPAACCTGQQLPSPQTPNNLISLAWEDLNPSGGGRIDYLTLGAAPNRIFVLNYKNVPHFGSTDSALMVTTQLQLRESDNSIEIHTTQMNTDGGFHTMGIENAAGDQAAWVPGRNGGVWSDSGSAWRFESIPLDTVEYVWSPAAGLNDPFSPNPIASPDSTTTYQLSVNIAGDSCVAVDFVTINVSTSAGYQILGTVDHVLCGGEDNGAITVQLTGGQAPFSFNWSNQATTQSLTNISGGTYTLEVSDAGGCTEIATFVVAEPQPLNFQTSINAASCAGAADGSAFIFAGGGVPPYTLLYDGGTISSNNGTIGLESLTGGYHSFLLIDGNGCTITDSIFVPDGGILSPQIVQSSFDPCSDAGVLLTVIPQFAFYQWSTGMNTQEIFASSAGTYSVTVLDPGGCFEETSIVIPPFNVPETPPVYYTNGELSTDPAYSYQWILNGIPLANQTNQTYNVLFPAWYQVEVVTFDSCALISDSVYIDPDTCAAVPSLFASNIRANSARLNWTPALGAIGYEIIGNRLAASGYAQLNVNDGNTLLFNVNGLQAGESYFWQVRTVCGNGLSQWSAIDTFTTSCEAPSATQTTNITANSARLNWVPVTGASGYEVTGRITGGQFQTFPVAGGNSDRLNTGAILAASRTYEWKVRAVCVSGGLSTYTPLTSFTTLAAKATASIAERDFDIQVVPNPNNGEFVLISSAFEGAEYEIYDMLGKQLAQPEKLNSGSTKINIDLAGTYFVKVNYQGKTHVKRVVVQ